MFRYNSYRNVMTLSFLMIVLVSTIVGTGCSRYKKFTEQRMKELEQATNEERQKGDPRFSHSSPVVQEETPVSQGSLDVPEQPGCYLDRGEGGGWESFEDFRKNPQVCAAYDRIGKTKYDLNESESSAYVAELEAGFIPVKRGSTIRVAQRFTSSQLQQSYPEIVRWDGGKLYGFVIEKWGGIVIAGEDHQVDVRFRMTSDFPEYGEEQSDYLQGYALHTYSFRNSPCAYYVVMPALEEKGIVLSLKI